ncbi:MAG: glycosyltransferase family 1 protein [bacterium]
MKKIGIDARLLYQTGVGVYLKNLLFYLNKLNPKNINFIVYVLKKDLKKVSEKFKNLSFIGIDAKWHTFSEQISFLQDLLKDDLDLMHFTYFSFPILYNRKYISTIHDTTLLSYKTGKASTKSNIVYNFKHCVFKRMFYKQVKKSLAIITPTETVKKQIIKLVKGVQSAKIYPIYEGVTREYLNISKNKNDKKVGEDYFLYVGTFYPHKNIDTLLKAYLRLKTDIKLYLVGPDDFFAKRLMILIDKFNLKSKVKIIKNVSQDKLPDLYRGAIALVHPSKSEGFGLPIIEAVYFKLPIIASNIDVFKEILGNKYINFDPKDVNDIKNKLQSFIKNRSFFDYKDILNKFSFEKMTNQTFSIYMNVLKIK